MLGRFPSTRLRRLRQLPVLRNLVSENFLGLQDNVHPIFITAGNNIKNPISSLPGHYQWSLDKLILELNEIKELGISTIILFGIPESKDAIGSRAFHEQGIIQQAIRLIKKNYPELFVIADICCCEYTEHGHCGVVKPHPLSSNDKDVDNDATLELLAKQAISISKAGADMLAPSGMMDGMVTTIRTALDNNNFKHVSIMSYAVKYASSYYGAFRHAVDCSLNSGDRKSYQMDPANGDEAIREAGLDLQEGADILMVKPAQSYLDVIYRLKQNYPGVPLAAYHVSGEYVAICAAATQGWIDKEAAMLEVLLSIKRAGAKIIINYFVKELAKTILNLK